MLTPRGAGEGRRLVLLASSPRVAPGLLTAQAWDVLRSAAKVTGPPGHPQLAALAEAGITVQPADAGPAALADADVAAQPAVAGMDAAAHPVPRAAADTGALAGAAHPVPRAAADTGALAGAAHPARPAAAGTEDPAGLARLLAAEVAAADGDVVWLAGQDGDEATAALLTALGDLPGGGPAVTVLTGSRDLPGARLLDLVVTMDTLRRRCPWDARQTHDSLAPHLLEESYEALEALEDGDQTALREELGDVLLQVAFHSRVAAERTDGTGYTIDDVADGIVAKLVRRHPHVFARVQVSGADEVTQNWDTIKAAERAARHGRPASALDGVPFGQPALALAAQLQRRAERAGVPPALAQPPPKPTDVETPATDAAAPAQSTGGAAPAQSTDAAAPAQSTEGADAEGEALGEELFALAAKARAAGLDPELELRAAARRYRDRVHAWEQSRQDRPA